MFIDYIILNNFRALKNDRVIFDRNFNIIYGKNAQGKTSLIESVYFLASGKSFRTRKISEQISFKEKKTTIFAKAKDDVYAVELEKESKNFYKNREKTKYANYVGDIPVISFSPEDAELINGSPDIRRRFFNYEICQTDRSYLSDIMKFQKILKVRNQLIKKKETNSEIFKIYNEKYIELCAILSLKRKEYINKLSEVLNKKYRQIFGNNKELIIEYENFFGDIKDLTKEELVEKIRLILKEKEEKEIIYGYSLIGSQKDDYNFILADKKVKSFASQGEKKSILLALKIAIGEYIIERKGETPIYLLDDISAYFDEIRKYSVLDYFKEKKMQVFFTSTEKLDIEGKCFNIDEGVIYENV